MSPRPYRLGQRQAATEQTRARIIAAARELLAAPEGLPGFTVDAIARQAGVARMTVYYQFGSKLGLLEAIFDSLAAQGHMERLATAFQQPDPIIALAEYIAVFGHFWSSDRLVIRRLHGLAALDPEVEGTLRAREERRRGGLGVLVRRLAGRHGRPAPDELDNAVAILFMLTSFESYDALAGPAGTPEDVVPLLERLACTALGFEGG